MSYNIMGNCWDAIDLELAEINGMNIISTNSSCSQEPLSDAVEQKPQISQEVVQKLFKFRARRHKLNTIIEDKQEDNVSSPFCVRKLQYN